MIRTYLRLPILGHPDHEIVERLDSHKSDRDEPEKRVNAHHCNKLFCLPDER
ncbi:hypothetical protein Mapa_003884 [Marchantia paleacea]|nr:hypothetical protein Mapa_003884 [Marchantia paleacea]